MSKTGVGCELRSVGEAGAVSIEVKGHASTGDVVLYYTERQMVHRVCGEVFIYEVNYAPSELRLRIVQDPVRQRDCLRRASDGVSYSRQAVASHSGTECGVRHGVTDERAS